MSINCPCCGSKNTEKHGANPGDYPWYLCRNCGFQWEDDVPASKEGEG